MTTVIEFIPPDTLARDLLVKVLAAMVRHDLGKRNYATSQQSPDDDTCPADSDTGPERHDAGE